MAATGPVFDLSASDAAGPVTVFRKPITLELTYGTLRPAFIYYWDGEAWLQTPTTFAAGQHRAAAQTPHLTPFVGLATVAVPVAQGTPGIPTPLVVGGLLLVGGAIAASAVAVRRLSPAPEAPASPTKRSRQKPK